MSLEIVIGPMFSGKSTYALSYARRYRAIGKSVLIVKPDIDSRYTDAPVIISHDREQLPCMTWDINLPFDPSCFVNSDCIVIEEAQFFSDLVDIVEVLLLEHRKNILLVGLDGDAYQRPFGQILQCIPLCSKVTRLNAHCSVCKDGTPAYYTKRLNPSNNTNQVLVGGSEVYEAVCLKHL